MAILPVGIGPQEGGYQIERSLRFNSADSAYLSRTPGSAGNRRTFTMNYWLKRSELGTRQVLASAGTGGNAGHAIELQADNTLNIYANNTGASITLVTTQVFRDPSAWGMLTIAFDTTQATSSNRVKIYWNGVQITAFSTATYPSQNADLEFNNNVPQNIGRREISTTFYCGLYLAETIWVDGQQLDPTSFGEYNSDTGVWQPKAYTGSYGTNGFYLDFADNSSTTALGYDAAGSNDWTPNNFSVTAGAGNDSLVDTPTPYGTDTGVGGEVRGNYATLNPLDVVNQGLVLSNGNLNIADTSGSSDYSKSRSTIWFDVEDSNGFYAEFTTTGSAGNPCGVGIIDSTVLSGAAVENSGAYVLVGRGAGGGTTWWTYNQTSLDSNTGIANASGQTLSIAVKNGSVYFAVNGTWVLSGDPSTETNPTYSGLTGIYAFYVSVNDLNSTAFACNFGQRPFAYTAPSGFKALCTQNLPEPTVVDGGEYFNASLYSGNSSTVTVTNSGFQPDLVWIKDRSQVTSHVLTDAVRGVTKQLFSNLTNAEQTNSTYVTSFNSDGFTVGVGNSGTGVVNNSGDSFVGWQWKANGAGVSNTDGTITSTVSANPTAGFSIVTYTGNATLNASVGHGLGVKPSLAIYKNRTLAGTNWQVNYDFVDGSHDYLTLNTTNAKLDIGSINLPTSSVVYLSSGSWTNGSGDSMVAYVFAPVEGYSAFGSYTGNGSTDGPFVFLNFRPRWLLIKDASGSGAWWVGDSERASYNVVAASLLPNTSAAESSAYNQCDFLSNGFKWRADNANSWPNNANGNTYIYAAFAEVPFSLALAR